MNTINEKHIHIINSAPVNKTPSYSLSREYLPEDTKGKENWTVSHNWMKVVLKNTSFIDYDIDYDYMDLYPVNNKYCIKKDNGEYKFFYYFTPESKDKE